MLRSLLSLAFCVVLGACSKAPAPLLPQPAPALDTGAIDTLKQENAQLRKQVQDMTNQLAEANKTIDAWQVWGEEQNTKIRNWETWGAEATEKIRNWEAWAEKQQREQRAAVTQPNGSQENRQPPELCAIQARGFPQSTGLTRGTIPYLRRYYENKLYAENKAGRKKCLRPACSAHIVAG